MSTRDALKRWIRERAKNHEDAMYAGVLVKSLLNNALRENGLRILEKISRSHNSEKPAAKESI